jgi:acetylornithine deacetylase/succinyl-diaminopimelate desuccinylase-like protein
MPFPANTRTSLPATPQQEVQRVAQMPAVHAAYEWFRSHDRQLSDQQLEFVRIPAPPFGEQARSAWLRDRFTQLGLADVQIDELGDVLGVRRGTDPNAKFIAVSAHIDTVFPAGTPLNVRRDGDRLLGPGISDNGAGVISLLAIAGAMQESGLRTAAPIIFIGNVGEEGEGDLRGMRHIFSEPRWRDAIESLVVVDGAGTDTIVNQALGSRRFEVTVRGPGGHSWSDFGAPNPIVLLARAIDVFSRTDVPANPKTTYNIGVISGGTSVNSIPESASMRVDIRSSSTDEIERVEKALRQALASVVGTNAAGNGSATVTYEVRAIGKRPAAELPESARVVQVVRAVDALLNNNARLHRASTDANIPISMGKEAVAIGAGGSGGGAHTVHEWYDPRGRDLGLKRILLSVLTLAGAEPGPQR